MARLLKDVNNNIWEALNQDFSSNSSVTIRGSKQSFAESLFNKYLAASAPGRGLLVHTKGNRLY